MTFDAVIFDCDGVLVDSEVLSIRGEREVLAEMGLHYDPPAYVERYCGMHDDAFFKALRADYESRLARAAPDDFEERLLEGRRRRKSELQAVPGAADAARAVKALVANVAVASSSRAHFLKSKLERTALYDVFAPHVYSADLVARGKPAPDVFLYAADRVGVAPERCLVLEDSVNGVTAGAAAGMTVWGFAGGGHIFEGHTERLREAGAAAIVASFADLSANVSSTLGA
ncbi:MAG: HAD family phosphatase [Pseudomonadota bacterium]